MTNRDWERIASSKVAHWATRYRAEGWRSVWDAAQALHVHMTRVRPDFPSDRDRERDLAHHVEMRRLFDRVADAIAGR